MRQAIREIVVEFVTHDLGRVGSGFRERVIERLGPPAGAGAGVDMGDVNQIIDDECRRLVRVIEGERGEVK